MGLHQKIEGDARIALKKGETVILSVLRMLISAIKMQEIEKNVKELDEASILQIIQRHVKQHRESIEQFEKGNRPELVKKETEELRVLEAFLPAQLTQDELAAIVKSAIAETGALTKADVGKIMRLVMEKVRGRSDGQAVSQTVRSLLK